MVEDVLVKVRQFTFPADFVIMDIEEDVEIPLILGRPFMLIANCVVDMGKGNLEMSMDDQKVIFNLFEAMKHPSDHKACFKVEKVEHEIDMVARAMVQQSPLEKALTNTMECLTTEEEKEVQGCLEEIESVEENPSGKMVFEELKKDSPIEKAKVELKTLPEHLKYVFIGENEANSMIISNSLRKEEEFQLVKVLNKHKAAIGWHISDLKAICSFKANMSAFICSCVSS